MTDVQKILENTEYALKKLKNSCVETIKDRDRMSKEMFEIYKKKGKEADACFAVGLSAADMSLLYSRMYQLIAHSEVSLTALRLTYNALNILEIRFPQQVKRTKSDLKKQIQKMAIGLDDSESMKRNIELVRKAHNEIRKR